MTAGEAVEARPVRRSLVRPMLFTATLLSVLGLMFGVPWWTIVAAANWPGGVRDGATVLFGLALLSLPVLMVLGHGPGHRDWAARAGDTLLGIVWVLFAWAVLGNLLRPVLGLAEVTDPLRSRIVSVVVVFVSVALLVWGYVEAIRLPRIKRVDVTIPRLGVGLDGTRLVLLTDTHYGPIDRSGWSARVTEAVNELDPDVVCHTGDIADGTPAMRAEQAAPLAGVKARLARAYVTGNHEYFGHGQGWLDHMRELGWEPLHNRHVIVERGGDRLVLAGIDDITATGSTEAGHGADTAAALAGVDRDLPVVLLAHQPKQVDQAVAFDVDLQISGHTHAGQIWPFRYLVRLDQPVVSGLSRHGARTQLYTSNGTGFWGPPFRIFAASEITLITLRAA